MPSRTAAVLLGIVVAAWVLGTAWQWSFAQRSWTPWPDPWMIAHGTLGTLALPALWFLAAEPARVTRQRRWSGLFVFLGATVAMDAVDVLVWTRLGPPPLPPTTMVTAFAWALPGAGSALAHGAFVSYAVWLALRARNAHDHPRVTGLLVAYPALEGGAYLLQRVAEQTSVPLLVTFPLFTALPFALLALILWRAHAFVGAPNPALAAALVGLATFGVLAMEAGYLWAYVTDTPPFLFDRGVLAPGLVFVGTRVVELAKIVGVLALVVRPDLPSTPKPTPEPSRRDWSRNTEVG